MRYTLLEIVQLLLGSLDSDEVDSIADTVESNQVANLVKSVYYDLSSDLGLPEHETAIQLNASNNAAQPCLMTVPDNVVTLRNVMYDKRTALNSNPDYQTITHRPFQEFLIAQQSLREDPLTVVGTMNVVFNGETYRIMYRKDVHPTYYTTLDDQTLLFDSYNNTLDTTLQKSKTMCLSSTYVPFLLQDNFYPDLDPSQFSLLINRSKVRAFKELKQQDNAEAAGEARRQKVIVQKRKRKTPDQPEVHKVARFGRK